jgi:hypothetical protein
MAPMGAWLPWSEMTEKVSVFVAASFIGWFKGTLLGSLIPKKKINKQFQDCMFRERHFVWENTVFSCMDHDSRGWNCNRAPTLTPLQDSLFMAIAGPVVSKRIWVPSGYFNRLQWKISFFDG